MLKDIFDTSFTSEELIDSDRFCRTPKQRTGVLRLGFNRQTPVDPPVDMVVSIDTPGPGALAGDTHTLPGTRRVLLPRSNWIAWSKSATSVRGNQK